MGVIDKFSSLAGMNFDYVLNNMESLQRIAKELNNLPALSLEYDIDLSKVNSFISKLKEVKSETSNAENELVALSTKLKDISPSILHDLLVKMREISDVDMNKLQNAFSDINEKAARLREVL